ncbi:hypothetical protein PXJ20_07110 [Paraburkholderia sp. A1RI_3L]|uniref:hypothetical protein n=1 Tax=Paraburkholderia TaxID=1822464 RepID=UPI003B7D1E35
MQTESSRAKSLAVAIVCLLVLAIAYYKIFHLFAHSSDEANPLLSAYDMVHGNWLLRGWVEPVSTFYGIDLLLFGAQSIVFGKSPTILVITPALIWAMVVLLSCAVVAKYSAKETRFFHALCAFVILGLPQVFNGPVAALITVAPIHIGSIVYALIAFVLAQRFLVSRRIERLAACSYFLLVALMTLGDPFSPYFCAAPVLLTCLSARRMDWRRRGALGALTSGAVIAGKVGLVLIGHAGGFSIIPMPAGFVMFDLVGKNVSLVVQGILGLFGADFFGKPVSPVLDIVPFLASGPLPALIRLPIVLLLCFVVSKLARPIMRSVLGAEPTDQQPITQALFWAILLVIAANLFSTLPINLATSRYLLPVYVFGAILVSMSLPRVRMDQGAVGVIAASSVVSIVCGFVNSTDQHRFANGEQQQLAAWLTAHDLKDGYGPYWSAGIVTVLTHGQTTVNALAPGPNGKLTPLVWISSTPEKPLMSNPGRKFVVVENRQIEPKFSQEQVVATFGEPSEIHQVGPYTVDVFDNNKATTRPSADDKRT